jgi:hypothetical protein
MNKFLFQRYFFIFLPAIIFAPFLISAQKSLLISDTSSTQTVIPGIEYKRSGWHNIFWGKHYRREWSTPVTVSRFYIDTAMGGLTPSKEGGGRQTKTLRLKNVKDKEYVLRSVDKDYGKAIPEIFHGTFIEDIAKDQTSTGYPFAAITITPMIEAAGVYHTTPKIIFVPRQPALKDFNEQYGNKLYLFEERADENQEDAPNFGNTKNAIGTEKLFEKIYGDNDHHVDQKAFARARLFDMFIGDWGRHPDNWRWAEFKDNKQTIYKPIPRDRDQAYTKFDGVWPWIAVNVIGGTHLESFDYKIHNVKNFNRPGWPLDRHFANELTQQEWIDIAKDLQNKLTDAVIENGIHQLPPPIFAISGEIIIAKLKSRRDQLDDYAKDYYLFLSHHVDLIGSNERELFEINRLNDNETQVNIYKITKENEVKSKPYFSRTFRAEETNEIRLYSLDKEDVFKITGDQEQGVKVRIIDPQGIDSFHVQPRGRTKTSIGKKFFFDTAHTKKMDFFILPALSPPEYHVFEDDPLGFTTRTGLRISANIRYIEQPWRKTEHFHQHLISANYGITRNVFNVGYVGRFGHAIFNWDLLLKARMDMPAAENYFGIGNETEILDESRRAYQIKSNRFFGGVGLDRTIGKYQSANISLLYQTVKIKEPAPHNISTISIIDPEVYSSKYFGGAEAVYTFKKTNNDITPTSGINFNFGVAYMENLQNSNSHFTKLVSSAAFYVPLGKSFSIAVRGGGGTVKGDADFYHLNKIGGFVNLRGYERERFYGKTSFYNNNELRWITNTKNYFFNGKIGLLAFYDQGRVWQPLETSTKWHTGYGGGLILVPFNRIALTGTYCISEEDKIVQLKAGLFF